MGRGHVGRTKKQKSSPRESDVAAVTKSHATTKSQQGENGWALTTEKGRKATN